MFKIYLSIVTKVYNDGLTQIQPRVQFILSIHYEVKLTFETLMLKHPVLSASRHACSTVYTQINDQFSRYSLVCTDQFSHGILKTGQIFGFDMCV